MTTRDLFEETYSAVTVNKVRSGLTMLGIVIGIASVIALVAVGQGSQASIQANIDSLGANLVMITPGAAQTFGSNVRAAAGSSETLTPDDATAIGSVSNVAAVAPEISGRYQVIYKAENTNTSVMGTTAAYTQVRNLTVDTGNFITATDVSNSNRIAVIGPTVLQALFAPSATASATPSMAIGQTIKIKGTEFTVVGVTVAKGGSGFSNQDDMIYMPLTAAQHYLLGSGAYVTEVDVEAATQNSMTQVQNDITTLLLSRHNIADPTKADFSVLNQASIVSTASSVTGTFTTLLAAIAAISLLVGGIGIMNMMLTTVTERTREIGLRKAVGIKKIYINMQFLAEAVLLTFLGGFIGIIIGWIASLVLSKFVNITAQVSIPSILLAFGVSAAVGIIFGFYPARKASNLSPIEALRYE